MGTNRIEKHFRDPTLERPQMDYYRVRLPWESFFVTRETAARILAAVGGSGPPRVIRCETITGSVVYVRTDTVVLVTESTRAQREAERRLWKELDGEEEQDNEGLFGD
jgi:hypothetical protein